MEKRVIERISLFAERVKSARPVKACALMAHFRTADVPVRFMTELAPTLYIVWAVDARGSAKKQKRTISNLARNATFLPQTLTFFIREQRYVANDRKTLQNFGKKLHHSHIPFPGEFNL